MKKLYTYVVPRSFNKYYIPIAIQSCYLKDYSQRSKLEFVLPITELSTSDVFIKLKENIKKKNTNLAMTSIFILPINKPKLLNKILKNVSIKNKFHFVLENLILNKKEILEWTLDYRKYSRIIKEF